MKTRRTLPRPAVPVLAGLAVIGIAIGIIAFRIGSGPGASAPPGDTQTAAEVELRSGAPDGVAESAQLPRRVVSGSGFVDQRSARSIEALTASSDVVVIGTVISSQLVAAPEYIEIPNDCSDWAPSPGNEGKQCSDWEFRGMWGDYKTHYGLRVDRYLKTDGTRDQELTVRQRGGVVNGVELAVLPDPFYEEGRRYLLFLAWSSEDPNATVTIAADLGAYELNNGQVDRLPEAKKYDGGAPLLLEGLTEHDALTLVESVVAAEVAGP